MKHHLSIAEFCAAYGVGRTRAYALVDSGQIKAVKIGRSTRITVESAETWRKSLPSKPPAKRGERRKRRPA
ncbi:MAG: helix-turn-helix domain-containing protein [Hyphomonadaceae bacterium]|nr:helix-turn-helix domain-containing protein [Hyphomonadaceae bacterium]